MKALGIAFVLFGLALGIVPSLACDETCAPGFVFDDAQGTCIRVTTS